MENVRISRQEMHLHVNGIKKHSELGEFYPKQDKKESVKKTETEKAELLTAKAKYKALLKNKELFKEKQTEIVQQILKSHVPNWGSVAVKIR